MNDDPGNLIFLAFLIIGIIVFALRRGDFKWYKDWTQDRVHARPGVFSGMFGSFISSYISLILLISLFEGFSLQNVREIVSELFEVYGSVVVIWCTSPIALSLGGVGGYLGDIICARTDGHTKRIIFRYLGCSVMGGSHSHAK